LVYKGKERKRDKKKRKNCGITKSQEESMTDIKGLTDTAFAKKKKTEAQIMDNRGENGTSWSQDRTKKGKKS